MRKIRIEKDRLLAIAVARLTCQKIKQDIIARKLVISQGEVSKLLGRAKEAGFLESPEVVMRQNIDEEDWEKVEQRYFAKADLLAILDKRLKLQHSESRLDLRVFSGNEDQFTFAAAGRVIDLLCHSQRIGIMWGRTLEKVIGGIKRLQVSAQRPLECVPLCGEPLFCMTAELLEYSASQAAVSLAKSLGVPHTGLPCLTGVPAYVRQELLRREDPAKPGPWEKYLHDIPNYQRIYGTLNGPPTALIDKVDTILTGVGIVAMRTERKSHETGVFIRERIAQENITHEGLDRQIMGDIGGLLVERPGLHPDQQTEVDNLNLGWTGIKARHLEQLAANAKRRDVPGVIVVAYGATKAEMINEIVRRGFVNELIIDEALAEALKKIPDN